MSRVRGYIIRLFSKQNLTCLSITDGDSRESIHRFRIGHANSENRMIELQALVAEVLEHFEFGVPEENYEIIRAPAGVMVPLVRGKYELGAVMPLSVSMVQA